MKLSAARSPSWASPSCCSTASSLVSGSGTTRQNRGTTTPSSSSVTPSPTPATSPGRTLSRQSCRGNGINYPYVGNGRFSNGIVRPDLIANIIGESGSPPAYMRPRQVGPAGMNFAVGGSGVFYVYGTQTLRRQVHTFGKLVKDGYIEKEDLAQSLALVAVSGNDYAHLTAQSSSSADFTTLAQNVTAEIVMNVARLQDMGVQKVLVNNLYPIGCAPSRSRPSYYAPWWRCDEWANQVAAIHNRQLADKLAGMDADGVLVLDLSAAFSKIGGDEVAQHFVHKLTPCCVNLNPDGYCGQQNKEDPSNVVDMYTVCDNPDEYFYWDDMNPTQAGWAAVMAQLESPIVEFLEM